MKMKKYLLYIAAVLMFASCANLDDAEYVDVISLGALVDVPENKVLKSIDCPKEYGDTSFRVLANCQYTASIYSGSEWLSFIGQKETEITMEGESLLEFSFTSNNGECRMAKIVLEAPGRTDAVCIRQMGLYESYVKLMKDKLTVDKDGGEYSVAIESSALSETLSAEAFDENLSESCS